MCLKFPGFKLWQRFSLLSSRACTCSIFSSAKIVHVSSLLTLQLLRYYCIRDLYGKQLTAFILTVAVGN